MGYDVKTLQKDLEMAFEDKDPNNVNNFLKKYKIDYIYLAWAQKFTTDSAKLNIESLFENKDARIFKVKNEQ